jgi:hypothetical protein
MLGQKVMKSNMNLRFHSWNEIRAAKHKLLFSLTCYLCIGNWTITQAVRRCLFAVEACAHMLVSTCVTCGRQGGTGAVFSLSPLTFPCRYHYATTLYSLILFVWRIKGSLETQFHRHIVSCHRGNDSNAFVSALKNVVPDLPSFTKAMQIKWSTNKSILILHSGSCHHLRSTACSVPS